jgi:hypothetical protein
VYRQRWGIERVFQQVTEVFHLRQSIATTRKATVFQAALCFLLFNMIQLIRAYVSEGQKMDAESISAESLFGDVRRQLVTWIELLKPTETIKLMSTMCTASQIRQRLGHLLHRQWSDRWTKMPSNTHKAPKQPRTPYLRGGHNSVHRLLVASPKHVHSSPLPRSCAAASVRSTFGLR